MNDSSPQMVAGVGIQELAFARISPVVQWSRLCAFTAGAHVRSLVGDLRSYKLCEELAFAILQSFPSTLLQCYLTSDQNKQN